MKRKQMNLQEEFILVDEKVQLILTIKSLEKAEEELEKIKK